MDTGISAPRIFRGSDGGQEVPVGAASVEERSDAVVAELPEPERCSLDPFDEVVDRFSGAVGGPGAVPVHDLDPPPGQRATEGADLDGEVVVLEIGGELGEVAGGQVGLGMS